MKSQRITVSIYQNAEHVSGILQQAYRQPLVIDESRESQSEHSQDNDRELDASGKASGSLGVHFLGKVAVEANTGGSLKSGDSITASAKSTQNFVYSQATYLYIVRERLEELGQLKNVSSIGDATALQSGDFVEYQATFRPNELGTILDVLTPELVAEIVRSKIRHKGLRIFDDYPDMEKFKRMAEKNIAESELWASLASSITKAVRADFRSEKTREYYGSVYGTAEPDIVTAVTICDNNHFVVDDEDRILDGVFTVLGKVISSTESDVPILERNKILERFQPKAVDHVFGLLRTAVEASKKSPITSGEFEARDMIDLQFASRIPGTSFRVIPIAIYA